MDALVLVGSFTALCLIGMPVAFAIVRYEPNRNAKDDR